MEILLQRLPNGKRKPVRFYKSAGFAAFPEAGWTVTIETGPGWVAVEAGIVEASSGRTGLRTPLGKVEVVGERRTKAARQGRERRVPEG